MRILQQFPVLPNGRTAGDCFVLSSFLVKGRWLLIKDLIPMACLDLFDPSHFLDALASLESGSVGRYVRHRNCGSTIFREILFSGLKDFRS